MSSTPRRVCPQQTLAPNPAIAYPAAISHPGHPMSTYTIAQAKDQLSRLVDEAMTGELVTLTRHGERVADITPIACKPRPSTPEEVDEMARKRALRPRLGQDSVSLVREMRGG